MADDQPTRMENVRRRGRRSWHLTDADRQKVIDLWQPPVTAAEVAAATGVSEKTVYEILKAAGVVLTPGRNRFSREQQEAIAAAYAAGASSSALAKEHDVFSSTIVAIVRRFGGQIRPKLSADLPPHLKRCSMCREVKNLLTGFRHSSAKGVPVVSSRCFECDAVYRRRPDQVEYRRASKLALTRDTRKKVIAGYGGSCACCGESRWEFLTIDHTAGGGHQHRKRLRKKGLDFYLWLLAQGCPRDAYRPLCFNCNLASGFYGGCPHDPAFTERPAGPDAARWRAFRAQAVAAYGGRCECCGESHPMFLAFDHVNGGGSKERREVGLQAMLCRLRREGWPRDDMRLLCHNCNGAEGMLHYCPHRARRPRPFEPGAVHRLPSRRPVHRPGESPCRFR